MPGYTPDQLELRSLVWCMRVTVHGKVYRFSTHPIRITDSASGDVELFEGGLPPISVDFAIGDLSGEPDYRTVPIRNVIFPDDMALLREHGHPITGAPATLFWVAVEDTTIGQLTADLQDAVTVVSGKASRAIYGGFEEPCSFEVKQNPYDDSARIPASTAVVDGTTFTNYAEADEGAVYPLPFGAPGEYRYADGSGETVTSGCAGLIVEASTISSTDYADALLFALGDVEAEIVYVVNKDGLRRQAYVHSETASSPTTTVFPGVVRDNLGQRFSYAVLNGDTPTGDNWTTTAGALAFRAVENGPFWIGFSRASGYGRGLKVEGKALEGAGDVLMWALRQSSIPVSIGAWEAVRPWLNRYRLAGYIDAVVSPWEWVAANLLPILPLSIVAGPQGLVPVVWRPDATAREARGRFVAGPGVDRIGGVEDVRDESDLVNEVRVTYALRARQSGVYLRTATAREVYSTDEVTASPTLRAVLSYDRGVRGVREIKTRVVYDEATAWLIAFDQLRQWSAPPRRVVYQVPNNRFAKWTPGSIILLTDTRYHWSDRVTVLENVTFMGTGRHLRLTFIVYDDPAREIKPAA